MSNSSTKENTEAVTIRSNRRFLLVIFLIGLLGGGAELILLEHTEDFWQLVPLLLMAICLVVLGWRAVFRDPASMRIFQGIMILFVLSGFVGTVLHYQGNVEFELEMYPSLEGLSLFQKSLKGATPTLAPGTMIVLGLVGLAYTYRHPNLVKIDRKKPNKRGETL